MTGQADFFQIESCVLESCSIVTGLKYVAKAAGIQINQTSDYQIILENRDIGEFELSPKGFQTRVNGFFKSFKGVPLYSCLFEANLFLKDCELYCIILKKDFLQIKNELLKAIKLLESGFEGSDRLGAEIVQRVFK